MEEFNEDLPFGMKLEFGRRRCIACRVMKNGLYVVMYAHSGFPKAHRLSTCLLCAKTQVKGLSEKISSAAKHPDSYMLGAKL